MGYKYHLRHHTRSRWNKPNKRNRWLLEHSFQLQRHMWCQHHKGPQDILRSHLVQRQSLLLCRYRSSHDRNRRSRRWRRSTRWKHKTHHQGKQPLESGHTQLQYKPSVHYNQRSHKSLHPFHWMRLYMIHFQHTQPQSTFQRLLNA